MKEIKITDVLPPLYASWLRNIVGESILEETRADCSDCDMCKSECFHGNRPNKVYNKAVKCCSFTPSIPGFVVGNILRDESPELSVGRESVQKRIRERNIVSPYGLNRPAAYAIVYERARFGQNESLRCPHFLPDAEEGRQCSIWKYREALCSTFFCRYIRGEKSAFFWKRVKQLLWRLENSLSDWCLSQLDIGLNAQALLVDCFDLSEPSSITNQPEDEMRPDLYEAIWGKWVGIEEDFYKKSADLVAGLSWNDIKGICGSQIEFYASNLRAAHQKLCSYDLPQKLRPCSFRIEEFGSDEVYLSTGTDAVELKIPLKIFAKFQTFSGSSSEEILDLFRKELGGGRGADLLHELVDFEVLVAGD